jgi:hypothetical protein
MSDPFDEEELELAALHRAVAFLLRPLDPTFSHLALDATTMDNAAVYVYDSDPNASALGVVDAIRSDTVKGFLYHAHEHIERIARDKFAVLNANVLLDDPKVLEADRCARLVEAKLESRLALWITDQSVPFDHFLWTLCITGDPTRFTEDDRNKSNAVGSKLGIAEPRNIERPLIFKLREAIWSTPLSALLDVSVAELSHARWRMRDRPGGDPWNDWFAAEKALHMRMAPKDAVGSARLNPWVI